jgi:signal transduction histidine kinase
MLLKNPVFTGVDRRRLEILAFETTRLNKIVTDMLDFARPIKFEFARSSIVDLIQSSLDVMAPRIREKKITISRKFPKFPPHVIMDYEKMEQVVINLLLNSIEAIQDKGEIKITVGRLKGDAVRVQIADNGGGISPEDLPFIFDPFFSKKSKGTGLGLSNVKKILEAHGGSIKTIPEIPHGVCMSFTVPYEGDPARRQNSGEVNPK